MKKVIKVLFLSFVFGFGISGLSANPLENTSAVGVFGLSSFTESPAQAAGIEYEQWITPKIALGAIASAYFREDSQNDYNANACMEVKYSLFESEMGTHFGSRLYAYGMFGYNGWSTSEYDYATYNYTSRKYYNDMFASLGFGFEFLLIDHISMPINFGMAAKFPEETTVGFCMGTGIRYSF